MRRNIRKAAIREVGESIIILSGGWSNVIIKVRGYCVCLIIGLRKVIAEASRAGNPGDLGANGLSTANCGEVRTCAGEGRRELRCSFAVIGLTGCTDTCRAH